MEISVSGVVEVQKLLEGVTGRFSDLTPVLEVAVADTIALIDDAFEAQRSPGGDAWADLSPATASIRARQAVQKAQYNVARKAKKQGIDVTDDALAKARKRALEAAEKREENRRKLIDTGRLRQSITGSAESDLFRFGTNVVYAAAQHFGNPSNKVFGKAPGPIPARPYLPVERVGDSHFVLMTKGDAGAHWDRVEEMVAHYIATGEVK